MKPHNSSELTKFVSTLIQNKADKHQTQILEETADQISPCFKKKKEEKSTHIRLGHAGIVDFRQICRYQIFFKV